MILTKKLEIFVIFYLDNIQIYTQEVDYINSIQWVSRLLREHLMYTNLKKCRFH